MKRFKQLSTLAKRLLALESVAIKNNDFTAAHAYAMAWFDVAEMMSDNIKGKE